jgi:hypothetical protein
MKQLVGSLAVCSDEITSNDPLLIHSLSKLQKSRNVRTMNQSPAILAEL